MSLDVISVRGLGKSYGRGRTKVVAAEAVDFELAGGTVVLLSGPSGSGKTTLLHLLGGWELADEGSIEWDGVAVDTGSMLWSQTSFVPQRLGLLPELDVTENIALAKRVTGERVDVTPLVEALDLDGLEDKLPEELSNGEQQRVAVARALAAGADLLLADEPTASQDEPHARAVFGAIRAAAQAGAICVIAGHDPLAEEYVDEVITVRDGRITGRRGPVVNST